MARKAPKLKVQYSPRALQALDAIWEWNAHRYGAEHAQSYKDFLKNRTDCLATDYGNGKLVPSRPGYRYITIKRRSAGHGHIAVYEIFDSVVYILNFYHTAQDWQGKLARGEW